jgi:hypothetical protein
MLINDLDTDSRLALLDFSGNDKQYVLSRFVPATSLETGIWLVCHPSRSPLIILFASCLRVLPDLSSFFRVKSFIFFVLNCLVLTLDQYSGLLGHDLVDPFELIESRAGNEPQ